MVSDTHLHVGLVGINEFPAAVRDAAERRVRSDRVHARIQKTTPVMRRDFVERVDYVLERVTLDRESRILAAMEAPAEIVEREFAVASGVLISTSASSQISEPSS